MSIPIPREENDKSRFTSQADITVCLFQMADQHISAGDEQSQRAGERNVQSNVFVEQYTRLGGNGSRNVHSRNI